MSSVIPVYFVLGTSATVEINLKKEVVCESDWNEMKLLLGLIQCQNAPSEFTAIV
jgi:hypothetical protein